MTRTRLAGAKWLPQPIPTTYEAFFREVYRLLREHANAPAGPEDDFVCYFAEEVARPAHERRPREWRFGGSLGFGGKLYATFPVRGGLDLRVGCYPGDRTPDVDATLGRVSAAVEDFRSLHWRGVSAVVETTELHAEMRRRIEAGSGRLWGLTHPDNLLRNRGELFHAHPALARLGVAIGVCWENTARRPDPEADALILRAAELFRAPTPPADAELDAVVAALVRKDTRLIP